MDREAKAAGENNYTERAGREWGRLNEYGKRKYVYWAEWDQERYKEELEWAVDEQREQAQEGSAAPTSS